MASESGRGFRFRELPTELRYYCWDWAARLEAEDMILFTRIDHIIYPTKKLLSPLLSVNKESRSCALKVYDLHLEVHEGEGWEQVQRREWEAQQRNKSGSAANGGTANANDSGFRDTTNSASAVHENNNTGCPVKNESDSDAKGDGNGNQHGFRSDDHDDGPGDSGATSESSQDSSDDDDTKSSATQDDTPASSTKVSRPLIRVNLELSTVITEYWIRQYTRRPSTASLSELQKAKFFPTSPGPWRLGATPVSSIVPLSERSKVERKVLVQLNDSPGHKWQSFFKSSFPEGPASSSYPGVQTLFFLGLGLQGGLTSVFHDLNEMGWNQLRQKMAKRIVGWTGDEESDHEEETAVDENV